MSVTIDNPAQQQPIVVNRRRLTTHCVVVCGDSRPFHRSLPTHVSPADVAACLAAQTEPFDAITVIRSCEVAALSAALANTKTDLFFFLHDDDTWTADFVSRMRSVYEKYPEADLVYCDSTAETTAPVQKCAETDAIDLGFTAVATYAGLDFVAQPLSCLSMRRRIVERILPLVDDPDWCDQPAACLSIAASLASARIFRLPVPLVPVDSDTTNHDPANFAYRLKLLRLIGKTANQLGLNPDFVKQFLVMEYSSCRKDPPTITKYARLLQAILPDTRSRREILLSMYRNMKEHLRGDGSFSGYARRWWLKQKLLWTGKLAV